MTQAIVFGLVYGSTYALTAYGLTLSYRLSGVFNFAHGAIGMLGAFIYTDLVRTSGWPRPVALLVVILGYAPLVAFLGDRLLFRYLGSKSVSVQVAGTTLVALALFEHARRTYTNNALAVLPSVWGDHATGAFVSIGGVNVAQATLLDVLLAVVVIGGVSLLLRFTRFGIATRGVVDNAELATLIAIPVNRVRTASWVVGAMVATLAAVLIASEVQLDQAFLTLIVVDAAAAFVLGRMESPVRSALGGLVIGVLLSLQFQYLPTGGLYDGLRRSFGFLVLYGAALTLGLRGARGAVGRLESAGRSAARFVVPRRRALAIPVLLLCGITPFIGSFRQFEMATAFVFAVLFLSFFVVMGVGGFTSLAQLTFMGVGAFATARMADTFGVPVLLAILGGAVVAATGGLLAALPAIRVRGLLLAMITLALALFADNMVFGAPQFTGIQSGGAGLVVHRPSLFGYQLHSDVAFGFFAAAVYLALALLVRRGLQRGGLRMVLAARDNPEMCEAFGLNLRGMKVGFFVLGAGVAGLAGGLYVSEIAQVGNFEFQTLRGLVFLAVAVLAGTDSIQGALLGGLIWAFSPDLLEQLGVSGDVLFTILAVAGLVLLRTRGGSITGIWSNRSSVRLRTDVQVDADEPRPLIARNQPPSTVAAPLLGVTSR